MHGLRRLLISTSIGALVAVSGAFLTATSAGAYGRLAVWQIGISENCNNPSICGPNLGGFWGWVELDSNNTGDATLTGCGHVQGGGGLAGADHVNLNITSWTTGPGLSPSDFLVNDGTATIISSRSGGPPVTVPLGAVTSLPYDLGVPAAAGHYSSRTLFGFQAPPGTNFEINVVQLH
jgi:hypothetical protein